MKIRILTMSTILILCSTLAGCFGAGASDSPAARIEAEPLPGLAWWIARDGALFGEHYEGGEDRAYADELGPSSELPEDVVSGAFQATARRIRAAREYLRMEPGPRPNDLPPAVPLSAIGELVKMDSRDGQADRAAVIAAGTSGGVRTLLVRVPVRALSVFAVTTDVGVDLDRVVGGLLESNGESF